MNQEFFWPQYKVKPIIYGGKVQNSDEEQSKFQINITNPMLESITSINSEVEEPLKLILLQAGFSLQDFSNPENNSLFSFLRQESMKNTNKSLISKQQRKTQPLLPSRHSTIMPKKSIIVSQFHFSHSNPIAQLGPQVQQNQLPLKLQPKFASPDIIEQIKLMQQKKQQTLETADQEEEFKMLLKQPHIENKIEYSFSSSSSDEDENGQEL